MQNYEQFMKELGIEVPEDKKDALSAKMKENYKSVADYNKVVEKRDEYKTSLDDVQEKLKAFDDVDVEDLKGQIATLTTQLQDEKNAREKDAAGFELEKTVDTFMGEKKFVNDITAGSLREKLLTALDEDSAKGKSIDDIFKGLISDKDGNQLPNILVDEGGPKPTFTKPMVAPKPGTKLSPSELMKLANENPGMDVTQYM